MWLVSRLLPLLFCFVSIAAQQSGTLKKIELRDFRGLNTIATDLLIKPNELRIAHEVDFGATVGGMTTRKGFTTISTISGMDSILGIYAAYYSDGTQQLFIVADSAGVGYGNVYVTNKGSVNLTADSLTRIWQYWAVQGQPQFTQIDDNVYIVNGQQKGIVWDGTRAKPWPPKSPGEPLILPLNDAGNLDGEYLYRFTHTKHAKYPTWRYGSEGINQWYDGIIASRVKVNDGKVFIKGFPEPSYDSINNVRRWTAEVGVSTLGDATLYKVYIGDDSAFYTSDGSATYSEITDSLIDSINTNIDSCVAIDFSNDTFFVVKGDFDYGLHGGFNTTGNLQLKKDTLRRLLVYRTNGNPGRSEETDSVQQVKLFTIHYTDSTFYDTATFTDNVADGVLDTPLFIPGLVGRDSLGELQTRYGSPGYISMVDTGQVYDDVNDTSGAEWGIYYGIPTQPDTLGVMYGCTFIDTMTGIESPLGPLLAIFNDVGNEAYSNTVALPNIPSNDSGLVINLYRAHILQITYDSGSWTQSDAFSFPGPPGDRGRLSGRLFAGKWVSVLAVDTVVVDDYYLLGQYPSTDSQVTDSIRFDSLSTRHRYARSTPQQLLTNVFSWDNRLWGISGSKVWPSKLIGGPIDTLQEWLQANPILINPDDGDQITWAFPSNRGLIRVFKNRSNYNIFQNSALEWARVEVSGTHGCIASNSYARGFSGHYYLSASGVVRETEGPTIERTQTIELVSAKIKSFDLMSLVDKSAAIGFYTDRKYMLHVPAAGTTYVYDERANAWSTWSVAFQGAVNYGVETSLGFFPGDTMYFFNDSVLYRLGTATSIDTAVAITMRWQTGTLFPDATKQTIEKVGAWIRQSATERYLVKVAVVNEAGAVSDSVTFSQIDDPARYEVRSMGNNLGVFLLLTGRHTMNVGGGEPSLIDGIDIWYRDMDEVLVE